MSDRMTPLEAAANALDVTWGFDDPDGAQARKQARDCLTAAVGVLPDDAFAELYWSFHPLGATASDIPGARAALLRALLGETP